MLRVLHDTAHQPQRYSSLLYSTAVLLKGGVKYYTWKVCQWCRTRVQKDGTLKSTDI
jgi:hypothetical protein